MFARALSSLLLLAASATASREISVSEEQRQRILSEGIMLDFSGMRGDWSIFDASDSEFVFDALDFSTAYMVGTGNSVIIKAALNPNVLVDPFPDCSNTAQKLRTHLLLNVQIL